MAIGKYGTFQLKEVHSHSLEDLFIHDVQDTMRGT